MLKRLTDIVLALGALLVFAIPMAIVAIAVKLTSEGPALYWSDRVGQNGKPFRMPKFRSMRIDTPLLPTHMLTGGGSYLTPIGDLLRRSSVDELPQIWCVVKGEMSVVGPRPALTSQHDLLALRQAEGINCFRPGLTGWAQINGRDSLSIPEKVMLEAEYRDRQSIGFDLLIIWRTVLKVLRADGISH